MMICSSALKRQMSAAKACQKNVPCQKCMCCSILATHSMESERLGEVQTLVSLLVIPTSVSSGNLSA